ncbi:geranylgeranylglyceryl/heptaprenylglyceryl phosphate synthase [Winogradskyella alexanderae]|uniref:Geranylgeranylglyceryl phosphate synthase n=1 Tax=Winogradskyella alexanderae TaxID=2877123 RepID=A0ABS7XNE7_9FLAO|nr:geranylgeranylglyceryl/heptaprenylglyceryl phosphate synthase [Winogradskyella alexanderae]MCA0131506.1 geranylgeranylglyceryl/heptaprenylglyceryl phosphate synthase [Winogradskyella alexanderae]
MNSLYQNIIINSEVGKTQLAVLIDPDKIEIEEIPSFIRNINRTIATHIFVGGSDVKIDNLDELISNIKLHTKLPVILFPGDVNQISNKADGVLFLSLISGRNPDYLIGKQVKAVERLIQSNLEVIPTGYILIENGKKTSVESVSNTSPINRTDIELIKHTAKAGEFLGMKLIYLEAGSGALNPISAKIIEQVKQALNIPLIIGGGIRSKVALQTAVKAGADLVVIGNAFENDKLFFECLLNPNSKITTK